MAVLTIKDVLEHAERFEQMLADYYAGVRDRSTREGVRLLTDYMSRHRKHIGQALERLSPQQVARICAAPLRYEPQAADCRCFEGMELPSDATAADVLEAALTFDECLVRLFRQVIQQPVDEEIKELFESLLRAEQRDQIELKKIRAMDYF